MSTNTEYSDEGTIAHALLNECLVSCSWPDEHIGNVITCHDYPHKLFSPSASPRYMACAGSSALVEKIPFTPRSYSMAVTEEMADWVSQVLGNLHEYAAGHTVYSEIQVDTSRITGLEGQAGHVDALVYLEDVQELQIHDAKFGAGKKVSAIRNKQLMQYAHGALQSPFMTRKPVKRIRLVIHQPRLGGISEWDLTPKELDEFVSEVRAAVSKANEAREALATFGSIPIRYFNPGEEQCQFCPAQADCPALVAKTKAMHDYTGPLSHEKLAELYASIPLVKKHITAIEGEMRARLTEGQDVPGYMLGDPRLGNREWSDPIQVANALSSLGVADEVLFERKLRTPPALEKQVKKKVVTPQQWAAAADLITRKEGERVIVRKGADADDFENVEE